MKYLLLADKQIICYRKNTDSYYNTMSQSMYHSIDYVYCRCGYVFKLELDDVEITCMYCDKIIYDLDGYCKTYNSVVLVSDADADANSDVNNVPIDCKTCSHLTSNNDAISAFLETITTTDSNPRTILDDIQERMDSDPALVHKLITDIMCLEQDNADLLRQLDNIISPDISKCDVATQTT